MYIYIYILLLLSFPRSHRDNGEDAPRPRGGEVRVVLCVLVYIAVYNSM